MYLRTSQTSIMEIFCKNSKRLKAVTILRKNSITDIWQGPKYASENNNKKVYLGFKACHVMKFSIKDFFGKCDQIHKCGFGHIYSGNP